MKCGNQNHRNKTMKHLKFYESHDNKNLIQYARKVEELFYNYTYPHSNKNIELEELISELRKIESIERESGNYPSEAVLWFRFFSGDTAATSIREIETDLNLPTSHPNHKYMLQNIQKTSDLSNEMSIYFS